MNKSIFSDIFPLIETNAELAEIKAKFPEYSDDYVATACIKERRELVEGMWDKYREYADAHFISEIKTRGKFNERTWELYLGSVFLDKGLELKKKSAEGPDFHISLEGRKIWIEATAPGVGKVDPAEERPILEPGIMYSGGGDIETINRPKILRFAAAIKNKSAKTADSQYAKGRSAEVIGENDGYVIAVNSYNFCGLVDDSGYMVRRTLFAAGCMSYPRLPDHTFGKPFYKHEPFVEKQTPTGTIQIATDIFTNKSYEEVSAIIYSPDHIINTKDLQKVGNNLILVRNPFAKNPLSPSFPRLGTEWVLEGDRIYPIIPK